MSEHDAAYQQGYSRGYLRGCEGLASLESELALARERVREARRLMEKSPNYQVAVCARWEMVGMGSGLSPKFIGCDVYHSKDPNEFCTGCEMTAFLEATKETT